MGTARTTWVSVQEATVRLGLSRSAVHGRLQAGTLSAKRVGGRTLVGVPVLPPEPASFGGTISKEAAARLGMFEESVRKMVARGDLAGMRRGREHRFRPEDIEAYIEARRVRPGDLAWTRDFPGWVRQPGRRQSADV